MTYRAQLGVAFVLGLASSVGAADRHVPSVYPTIQAAIDAAADGDRVVLADGTYSGAGHTGLSLLGKAITVTSANGPALCIIDGTGVTGDPVFELTSSDISSRIEGITMRNVVTQGVQLGAVHCDGCQTQITGCHFVENTATGPMGDHAAGSAIHVIAASPVIRACVFVGNHGTPYYLGAGSVSYVIDSVFEDNETITRDGFGGGAIQNHGFLLSFFSHYESNRSVAVTGSARGGAIAHYGSIMDITDSAFIGNEISGAEIRGGSAVYAAGEFIVNAGRFEDHLGTHSGGAFALDEFATPDPIAPFLSGTFDDNTVGGVVVLTAGKDASMRLSALFCGNEPFHVRGPYIDFGANTICCPGDVDGDHDVGFADVLEVLAAWGSCAACAADIDGDGAVTFSDLLAVLSEWGTCPSL